MKVLVTGATGFLGGRLVSGLVRRGDEVRAFARKTSKIQPLLEQHVCIVYGDLKDKESLRAAVKDVDIVYHAGAAMSGSWEEYKESTINGTERILEVSLDAGVKRFVHISSIVVCQVYEMEENGTVGENCPCIKNPQEFGPYTCSKTEAERLAFGFYAKGLPVVVIRPGLVYGPGGKILFPHVGYSFGQGLFFLIGNGRNLLPFTYLDNTVDSILLAGTREEAVGQAYNIVDDEYITQRQYLKKYMDATDSRFLTLPVPISTLLFLIALAEPLGRLGFIDKAFLPSRYGFISKYKSLRFDNLKAKKELGWKPKVSLEEGLRRTFEFNRSLYVDH